MKKFLFCAVFIPLLICVSISLPGLAKAKDMYIYPAKGQSQQQLEKDKYDCYMWAKKETGFDPMQAPKATQPPPPQSESNSNALRGAARGAAVGAVAGAIAGDTGKGAAIGAGTGALLGGMKKREHYRQQEQAQDQWAQEQASQYQKKRNEYNRAFKACMEAKGYTVK